MDQSILLDAEVHEGSESRYVVDSPADHLTDCELLEILDSRHECRGGVIRARVTPRFAQFRHDIAHRLPSADSSCGESLHIDFVKQFVVGRQVRHFHPDTACHLLHDAVTFRMYARIVERFLTSGNTQKTGTQFKCLIPESGHFLQFVP